MAEPTRLYETCGPPAAAPWAIPLTASGLDVPVSTKCYFIDQALVPRHPPEVRLGLAAVQMGQTVPSGMLSTGYVSPNPTSTSAWIADTSLTSETEQGLVARPAGSRSVAAARRSDGRCRPSSCPTACRCTVYFPGTYTNPVTIDRPEPTYFASGIYYFEDTLTIPTAPTWSSVGGGVVEGCATDQYAAFYAIDAPSTHNINGLGATFVFGGAGRLVVANDVGGPIKRRSSTSGTWRPTTPARRRRPMCPSCP